MEAFSRSQLERSIHFTCDGVGIDITEHPTGLEFTDCASGETCMVYGSQLVLLLVGAVATLPNNVARRGYAVIQALSSFRYNH